MCLRGASEVSHTLVQTTAQHALPSYVVWVPMLGGTETHIPEATRIVQDERATHFWDGTGQLLSGYRQVLGLPVPAWDIYMVFGPETRWEEGAAPLPTFWMHQLGESVDAPPLDATAFSKKVQSLIENHHGA